ncbi:MAG: methyltransferase domain-containing protein [Lachnospiraceae bacterium]|nr:methyltransferase domain-containing protein [Lachnospiraceae bacterium]
MSERIRKNTVVSCLMIFLILIIVHGFEAVVLRTDETILGENCINKIFGIVMIFAVLRIMGLKTRDIGFAGSGLMRGIGSGLLLAVPSFTVSYIIELIILKAQGHDIGFGVFTTGFSLTGETAVHRGIGFILMCIFFNVINVVMEEGTFRGLFDHIVCIDHSGQYALIFQALLFGIWHIVTPLHNLIDGDMNAASFIGMSIGYIILAGLMGIKWGLLFRMTGNLYAGMADHFFNNCIATNLLHVVTEEGIDDLMIVRVMIAQLLSFAAVMVIRRKKAKTCDDTLRYYEKNAESFTAGTLNVPFSDTQERFLSFIPEGGYILDFGCGSGRDTKYFLDKGYRVDATDGSERLCELASANTGIRVKKMLFSDLDEHDKYDGIWACASILHLHKDELLSVLDKMIRALKPGAYMYVSFKYGDLNGYRKERYFTDFTHESFHEFIKDLKELTIADEWESFDVRPGRGDEKWLNVILKRRG